MKWLVKNTSVSDLVDKRENIVNLDSEGGGVKIVDDGIKTLVYETTKENERIAIVGEYINIDYVEIEGVVNPELEENRYYTFSTSGRHKVRLRLRYWNDDAIFKTCTNLIIIPQNLFTHSQGNSYLREVFYMTKILYIPKDLFKLEGSSRHFGTYDVLGMFNRCDNITYIPSGLFSCSEFDATEGFQQVFWSCTNLENIPRDLFSSAAEDIRECFAGCSKLVSIPEGLFDNCPEVTDLESCFHSCSSLKTIPKDLFKNNTKIIDFRYCFYNCTSLKSPVPVDSDGTPIYNRGGEGKEGYEIVTYSDNCFYNCKQMEGYDQIPEDWR